MAATLHALYTAVWANFWTPSAPTLGGLAWHYLASQRAHRRRQQDLKAHITATAATAPQQEGDPAL